MMYLLVILISCSPKKEVSIKNFQLNANGFSIDLDLKNVSITKVLDVRMDYPDGSNSLYFDNEKIKIRQKESGLIIELDAKNMKLVVNETVQLSIKIPGGFIEAKFFIGNQVGDVKPYYLFPAETFDDVRIIILKQYSYIQI